MHRWYVYLLLEDDDHPRMMHVVWSSRDTDWTIQCASTSSHRLHMCVRALGSSYVGRALPHKAGTVSQRCSHHLPPPFYRPVKRPYISRGGPSFAGFIYKGPQEILHIFDQPKHLRCTPALLRSVTRDPRSGPVC